MNRHFIFGANVFWLSFVLSALFLAGCGLTDMPNKMDQTNGNMNQMIDGMNQTNETVRQQKMMLALDHLFAKENTKYLKPVPTGMMLWGDTFAKAMHEDEFVQLIDLYLNEINDVVPDSSLKDPKTGKWPADLAAEVDREKNIKFYAIMIISSFASQAMIDQVVKTEITNGGQYTAAANAILAARSTFMHDVLLEEKLLNDPLDTPDKIAKAIERTQYLDNITALSFSTTIEFKSTGMLVPEDNFDLVIDPTASLSIWAQLDQAFDTDLQKKFVSPATATMREKVRQACRVHGNWDKKALHCTPNVLKR